MEVLIIGGGGGEGGFSATSCWKLPEMDKSSVKKFPSWGGGFLPQKPKLPEIA